MQQEAAAARLPEAAPKYAAKPAPQPVQAQQLRAGTALKKSRLATSMTAAEMGGSSAPSERAPGQPSCSIAGTGSKGVAPQLAAAERSEAAATQPCRSGAAKKAAPAVRDTPGLTATPPQQQQRPAESKEPDSAAKQEGTVPANPGAPADSIATQTASQSQLQQQSSASALAQTQAAAQQAPTAAPYSGAPSRSSHSQHAGPENQESRPQALPGRGALPAAGPASEQASAWAVAQGSAETCAAAAAVQSGTSAVLEARSKAGPPSQPGAAQGPVAGADVADAPAAPQADAIAGHPVQQGAAQGAAGAAASPAPAPPPEHHMQWGLAAAARARARKARKAMGLPTEPQPAELTPELRAQYAAMAAKLGIRQSPELELAMGQADTAGAEASLFAQIKVCPLPQARSNPAVAKSAGVNCGCPLLIFALILLA